VARSCCTTWVTFCKTGIGSENDDNSLPTCMFVSLELMDRMAPIALVHYCEGSR